MVGQTTPKESPSGLFSHNMDITTENDLIRYLSQRPDNGELLRYLAQRADSGEKQWFGRMQQRVTGITLAHEIAANHADKMTPEQVANYVVDLNNQIFKKIVIG